MNKGIIFLLLLFLVFLKAQQDDNSFTWLEKDNKGIKKIEILKNGKVGVTQFFNKQGNPVFIQVKRIKNLGFPIDNLNSMLPFSAFF